MAALPVSALLKRNHAEVEGRVAAACARAGRPRAAVRVLPVSKSVDAPIAAELLALGYGELAESRVDELERKRAWFEAAGRPQPRWHLIGHLQRNKARRALAAAGAIHSVDSLELLDALGRIARELGCASEIYLQLKLSDEPSKGGLAPRELEAALARAAAWPELRVLGLMTMAPLAEGAAAAELARATFERLAALARALDPARFAAGAVQLSMGMSGDFEQAIEAGATVVRVGSALFADLPPRARAGRSAAEDAHA